MRIKFIATLLLLLPLAAFAQNTPVGKWRTIDDKTGKVKSIVEIYETQGGTLAGKVLQVLNSDKGPNPLCDACPLRPLCPYYLKLKKPLQAPIKK